MMANDVRITDAERREAVHRAVRVGIESVRSGDADRDVVRAVADQVLALEAAWEVQ